MCGIFGIISSKPRKFDYSTFCTLGCYNDSRGGDSCGIFIDGKVEYGTGTPNKYFGNWFLSSKTLNEVESATISLGHCRKASIGGVGVGSEKAQPVVIYDKSGETPLFVLVHNGTVHNYLDLAKKYIPDIDVKDMTDSQVLARIFFYKGYDCLAEYNGGAAFVAVDYREGTPKVYFWKGVSKKSEYPVNAKPEEERPLEFVEHDGTLVFSSLGGLLPALIRNCGTLYTMHDNWLCTFTEEKGLVQLKQYDRSEQTQTKPYATSYSGGSSYSGGTSYSSAKTTTGTSTGSSKGGKKRDDVSTGILIQCANKNVYMRKSKLLHGKAILTHAGRFVSEEGKETESIWFYQGIPLNLNLGMQCFRFLEYLRKKSNLKEDEFVKKFENVVRYLSFDRLYFKNEVMVKATSVENCDLFTGHYHMIGNHSGSNYVDGKADYSEKPDSDKLNDYKIPFTIQEKEDSSTINLYEIREKCISLMK